MREDQKRIARLIILDSGRNVLMESRDTGLHLPEVTISRFDRFSHSANLASLEKYGMKLFHILSLPVPGATDAPDDDETILVICRLQNPAAPLPKDLVWQDSAETCTPDRVLLDAALKEFEPYCSGQVASSFGRYTAFDELRAWYQPHLAYLGVRETALLQWNGDPWFELFRIAVEPVGERTPDMPDALWFKAVGEPNTREYAVTQALTRECPHWFPPIVATQREWNGWLAKEIRGHELAEETNGRQWALTARVLAKIQKRFIGRDQELLDLQCVDWRMPAVLKSLDPFFERMEEIMRRQTKSPPRPLDTGELRMLKIHCRDLCYQVEDLDIPYTIAHGDFSPHNVIISEGWPWMIDWAESYLTFPFISWEHFWNRVLRNHPEYASWHDRMLGNYAIEVWEPLLGKERVAAGLRLSPPMAVLLLAMYNMDDPDEWNPRMDRVKRSLTRRLHREIEILQGTVAEVAGAAR